MKKALQTTAAILFSVAVTWFMLELVLRVAFDALPPGVQGTIQHVRRWPWSDENDTILPRQPFTIDRDFQVRMPVGLVDFPVRWSDAQFAYSTISAWDGHRAGLRSDPPEWPLDIMTFGDSFAWCWVKWADCWVKRLRTDDGWHTFNAAIPGTGVTGQANLIKELVPPMKPRLVVWLWFPNDISDDYDLAKIRGEVGDLPGAPYPDPERPLTGLSSISAVAALVNDRLDPPKKQSPYQHYQEVTLNGRPYSIHTSEYPHPYGLVWDNNRFGIERNLKSQADVHALLDGLNIRLLIVFLPVKEEAYAAQLEPTLGADYLTAIGGGRRQLLKQCEDNGWYCLDATPALSETAANGQTIFYQFDSHLDPSGNAVLVRAIADYIRANGLLDAVATR